MARPIAKDHDEKRALIRARAAALFAEAGFDRVSVAEVARAAGISKANVYHYYGAKDDILFDILDLHLRSLRDRICGFDAQGTPEARLRAALTEVLLAYQGADDAHRLQSGSIGHLSKDRRIVLVGYQRDLVTHMSGLLSDVAPGVFAEAPEKLRATTMSVFGMLNWFYMWNGGAGEPERRHYAGLVTDLCLKGLPGL
ncbi:MAG: TetR/AcrR family transcriptional regulator [Silicimonas sp.]|nr:TetR/AcrR family transcriptional regulator [Silicimonas sp.]